MPHRPRSSATPAAIIVTDLRLDFAAVADRAVAECLTVARRQPSALVIEGEAGIGKTTLWHAAQDQARRRGFVILSTRAATAQTVVAYEPVADLLHSADPSTWTDLPDPQRLALDRVLLRRNGEGLATDQRAVGAAVVSVITRLSAAGPVLLAIDDVQWLDASSAHVLAFAIRRLTTPVAVICTVRTEQGLDDAAGWVQLPRADGVRRVAVGPMTPVALHAILTERLGRSFSLPTITRIHEVSGGNPFYALELARNVGSSATVEGPLPGTLAELVRARLGKLGPAAVDALVVAACLGKPSVATVARALDVSAAGLADLLGAAEADAIVEIDGNRLRFTHPLLAHGVYRQCPPEVRRDVHRRLAEIVTDPELRARHLALADTSGDPETLRSLDAAAELARSRGAPAAAAELLELAIGLGGDLPDRQINLASCYFDAGEPTRARALLEDIVEALEPGPRRVEALRLLAMIRTLNDNWVEAAELLGRAIEEAEQDSASRAALQTTRALALVNSGQMGPAVQATEDAVVQAEHVGDPNLLSQALGMRVMLRFMTGGGFDAECMGRALTLSVGSVGVSSAIAPAALNALLTAWVGDLDRASGAMRSLRRQYGDRGEEGELSFLDFQGVLIDVWRGDLAAAGAAAEAATERARQLGGDIPHTVALTARAMVVAYLGRETRARDDIRAAVEASLRSGSQRIGEWPVTVLGFLEVSLGNHEAALTALEPMLPILEFAPQSTEIISASFVPDAAEAMIGLGRLDAAAPLIDALERNGRRLDRAWMLAVGGRCRAMLLDASGDRAAALVAAEEAMAQHARIPMPFERARTQLVLGRLQHRLQQWDAAVITLGDALATFERLGTLLWAERARIELATAGVGRQEAATLTAAELQVAELAVAGHTNRAIAAALFVSPKTVELRLSRVYRKLGIGSRSELSRRRLRPDPQASVDDRNGPVSPGAPS